MDLFGSSGVRGVAPGELTPELVLRVARATGTIFEAERVALGRDTRETGRLLVGAAASGLAAAGSDVDRLGVVPTPSLQAYCERESVPGVVITASHNPPEYNGVKLVAADGVELSNERLEAVESRLDDAGYATWDRTGSIRSVENANRAYNRELLAALDREAIADADLRVVIDPGHGAGALTSPELFRELGVEVRTIHAQPDGHFPGRDPEPVAENLTDLGRLVAAADADLGIAHDGDADRAMFFDETGAFVEGDAVLAALAAAELRAGDVAVSAVNASQRLVDVVEAADAELRLTPIGSTYITTAIRELRADGRSVPIAGEGNGGILFPAYRIARDGAYTAGRLCELLAAREASLGELIAPYDEYHNVRHNVAYDDSAERAAMLEAIDAAAEVADGTVDRTDGCRIGYDDGWVLARPSGTEPLVRVYAEARDPDRAAALAAGMRDRLAAV
ncbi:phosphoglucosamine mutase [Halobacteriales archaeon QH_10_67_13]|nr:MAG: phosphoglucosamine mutase [Halobacteriales archaeon QH_10_67_13]